MKFSFKQKILCFLLLIICKNLFSSDSDLNVSILDASNYEGLMILKCDDAVSAVARFYLISDRSTIKVERFLTLREDIKIQLMRALSEELLTKYVGYNNIEFNQDITMSRQMREYEPLSDSIVCSWIFLVSIAPIIGAYMYL